MKLFEHSVDFRIIFLIQLIILNKMMSLKNLKVSFFCELAVKKVEQRPDLISVDFKDLTFFKKKAFVKQIE